MVVYDQHFFTNKRVLVTGGAGFIGSHVVKKLVQIGAKVTVFDNFTTGTLKNLADVITHISIFHADIRARHSTLRATTKQDIVFHLAALISVPESINNPDVYYDVNVQGTRNILESCIDNNITNLVFSSSSAVYGDSNHACKETDAPHPASPYAATKLAAEKLCADFSTDTFSTACLRYFNVYGQSQPAAGAYASVVARFTHQLLAKEPITLFGDGTQTRDFIHVSDVVEANLAIATRQHLKGEVINVASGKSITLLALLEKLEHELGVKRVGVQMLPARPGDILHSQAFCEKIIQLAG